TSFRTVAGEPVQVVAAAAAFALPLIDLAGLPEGGEARRLMLDEARRPFDLGRGPLLRAVLLSTSAERHTVLLTMHHIVSDGWSVGVLVRELGALYAAFVEGLPSPLPELAVQYADFAAWQRHRLSGGFLESELAWWRGQLAGMPPALDLPTDRQRLAARGSRGGVHTFTIGEEAFGGLTALSRREGATLFMTLLAGFASLLHRYTGEADVAVGTPIAGRTRVETEPLIGLFVNTLVLRSDLSGDPEMAELLGRVRDTTLSAYAHQEVPFERLVEELAPGRDLSRSPLVQVLFSLQNAPSGPLELPDLALKAAGVDTGTAKLELTCTLTETAEGLAGTLEYSLDLFEPPTMARLAGHFTRLLEGVAADPGLRLSELPLLSEAEREQLLVGFNDTGATGGPDVCLHQLFEAQAARTPDQVALVAPGGVRLTYRELNGKADRLAARLRALGVGPEVMAGVLMDRTAELIIALLAVQKAGGAYAPLDPSYPRQRILLMLEVAQARVVVTRRRFAEALPSGIAAVFLDEDWESLEEAAGPAALPDNLAYVIFTSGSTGAPKGVAIQHRSAVAMVRWCHAMFTPEEYAGMLVSTSISFDMSVFEIFATLATGGKLLLAENALALPDLEAKDEVVLVDTVPSAMAELLRIGRLPSSIRTVNLGGEALKPTLVRDIYEKLPSVERVVNLYGPSEDTTFSTFAVVPRDTEHPLIGRPLTGESAYVLDRQMQPVPLGVPGALYMAGEGVTRGYLGRPDLTAERYIPNPYGPPGSRLYQVGDLVRYLPTGELDFLGRLDHQVKVRGFRIELGEIESSLTRHEEIREAAVLAMPDVLGGNRLVAYIETERDLPAGDLRAFLKASLPEYMVPSVFAQMREMPLTPNGKIDRRALAALPIAGEGVEAGREPRTPTEMALAGIWSEIFGQTVGVNED
ncbi:MAG TPA: amino acid adenylation domain-containing protein, partial [Thermoanaerobaculia bacterium]|nr:amino acid adenylation domain-containing protein [Thermoanaerobaculia bacterium]